MINKCYTLTTAGGDQEGAVWGKEPVDITLSFQVDALINLGEKNENGGADGIAFVI
jgi:hypothetical protein